MEVVILVAGWVLLVVGILGTAANCAQSMADLPEPPKTPCPRMMDTPRTSHRSG